MRSDGPLLISVQTFTDGAAADHPKTRVVAAEGEICLTFHRNIKQENLEKKQRLKKKTIEATRPRNLRTPKLSFIFQLLALSTVRGFIDFQSQITREGRGED